MNTSSSSNSGQDFKESILKSEQVKKLLDDNSLVPGHIKALCKEAINSLQNSSFEDQKIIEKVIYQLLFQTNRKLQVQKEMSALQDQMDLLKKSHPVETQEFIKFNQRLDALLNSFAAQMQKVSELNKKEGLPEGRLFWLEHEFNVLKFSIKHWANEFLVNCKEAASPEFKNKNVP